MKNNLFHINSLNYNDEGLLGGTETFLHSSWPQEAYNLAQEK